MSFEEYLRSKKIDSHAFRAAEEPLWNAWNEEFSVLSPAAFTAQKLYLINPVRRKYTLKPDVPIAALNQEAVHEIKTETKNETPGPAAKPAVPRPVFKPKPKL